MTEPDQSEMDGRSGRLSRLRRVVASERFRYLFVGGANTVVGFALFVVVELVIGQFTSYFVSLYVSFFFGSLVSFSTHRALTFRVSGRQNLLMEFLRFQGVNIGSLVLNTAGLPFFVEIVGLSPIVSQAILVIVTTVVGYLGHKYFSFALRYRHIVARSAEPEDPSSA